jgi:hypothetical protein
MGKLEKRKHDSPLAFIRTGTDLPQQAYFNVATRYFTNTYAHIHFIFTTFIA